MRGRIHSFGCSFSTRNLVPEGMFWLDILARKYKVPYDSWGSGASEFNEAFHRLTFTMKDFKKDDLVIFQFTDHNRLGVIPNGYYITTAMLNRNAKDYLVGFDWNRKVGHVNKTDDEFMLLYDFANTWLHDQMFWNYWRVWNTLKFLEEKIGIHFIILFLDKTWEEVIHPEHYHNIPLFPLPEENNNIKNTHENIALNLFCWDNKGYAIGHDLNYKDVPGWHKDDGHPGELGNAKMVDFIMDHIDKVWPKSNPYNTNS
jgi:hypothetical protein